MIFSNLFYNCYGYVILKVMRSSIMQKVFRKFVGIDSLFDVVSMVA